MAATTENGELPVFERCPRCRYPLRGLPAEHACPECGLRYDQDCLYYRASNRAMLAGLWPSLLGSSGMLFSQTVHLFWGPSGMRLWAGVIIAGWIGIEVLGVWLVWRYSRRGAEVFVTGDGLLLRPWGFGGQWVPWERVRGAAVQEGGPPCVVELRLLDAYTWVGMATSLFPQREDADRFVAQVNRRALCQ